MTKYTDIQYYVDESEVVETVEITHYRTDGENQVLEEQVHLEKEGVYMVHKKNEKSKRLRDRSVVLQTFILDDLGNPLHAMVLFRDNNTFGKIAVTELTKAI